MQHTKEKIACFEELKQVIWQLGLTIDQIKSITRDDWRLHATKTTEYQIRQLFNNSFIAFKAEANYYFNGNATQEPNKSSNSVSENHHKKNKDSKKELDNGDIEYSKVCDKPLSVDAAVKLWDIDLNKYEIKDIKFNTYPVYAKNQHKELVTRSVYQTKLVVKPISSVDVTQLIEHFRESIQNYSTPKIQAAIKSKTHDKGNTLYEVSIPDIHLGKLAWQSETGVAKYNLKEACRVFDEAVDYFVNKASQFNTKNILLPIGNDFFNSDNQENTTTAGTRQDEDSRWQKTFETGCSLCVDAINKFLLNNHQVNVIMVPGNHDQERVQFLGYYLEAWFKDCDSVFVDNNPTLRKYFKFENNLIGFTHGKYEKKQQLLTLMQSEVPKLWGASTYREWHLGHLHVDALTEENGFKVRRIPSLTAADAWHAQVGFTQNKRAAMGLYYLPEGKLDTINYYTIN